tara:strand:- start:430 stop:951 length:522 start_codon:yes stop_codon:yes gene_type:complete
MKDYNYTVMHIKKERHKLIKSHIYALTLLLSISIAESNDEYLDELITIPVSIENSQGDNVEFQVYITSSHNQRKRGLMHIANLPQHKGMLFHFAPPRYVSMWMKNTLIKLDIIFIDKNKRIIKIHKNAKPLSTQSIYSNKKAEWVLEINGGLSEINRLNIGNIVNFDTSSIDN